MKTLKNLNTLAIGLPLTLLIIGLIINDPGQNFIGFALFSTMLTGLIQVLLGLFLLYKNPNNKFLKIYFNSVILFFLLWYINAEIIRSPIFTYFLIPIPMVLAIYLSIIIYKQKN
ncbi:MAG: hypothetical protein V4666_02170 [Bacteroidota bacterium]